MRLRLNHKLWHPLWTRSASVCSAEWGRIDSEPVFSDSGVNGVLLPDSLWDSLNDKNINNRTFSPTNAKGEIFPKSLWEIKKEVPSPSLYLPVAHSTGIYLSLVTITGLTKARKIMSEISQSVLFLSKSRFPSQPSPNLRPLWKHRQVVEGNEARSNVIIPSDAQWGIQPGFQRRKLADSVNLDTDTSLGCFLLLTASHSFALMNVNASEQWIKGKGTR